MSCYRIIGSDWDGWKVQRNCIFWGLSYWKTVYKCGNYAAARNHVKDLYKEGA